MLANVTTFHSRNALSLAEAGYALGDPALLGNAPGQQGERLVAAAQRGEIETVDGSASARSLVNRQQLARYLAAHGSLSQGRSYAATWALAKPAAAVVQSDAAYEFRAAAYPLRAVQFSATGTLRKFSGIAYGGDMIRDHPSYEAVAFDLASTQVATPMPALLDHTTPIGVITSSRVKRDISVDGHLFADVDPNAMKVVAMADRGMPWQMSVYIKPGRVEQIKAGDSVDLNGRKFQGPLAVFRNNRVREVSFCALGADGTTSARVA